ncbi:MAG: hypothetical protein AAGJ32_05030 [Pseudomonadota bacterium]
MVFNTLVFGLSYAAVIGAMIILSYRANPRLWLHDYPQEMQALVPPKTADEIRQMRLWAIPVTGTMVLAPLGFALWHHPVQDFSYLGAFIVIWTVMQVFNLFDLIVLDWIVTVWWRPPWVQLEGAEHMRHHDNLAFHFRGFLAGLPIAVIGAAALSLPFIWL